MTLYKMIESIGPETRKAAESLLKDRNVFQSLKDFGDNEYESLIKTEGGILTPLIELNRYRNKLICQCGKDGLCVHLAAMLIGIEKMRAARCGDYHMALAKLEAAGSVNSGPAPVN